MSLCFPPEGVREAGGGGGLHQAHLGARHLLRQREGGQVPCSHTGESMYPGNVTVLLLITSSFVLMTLCSHLLLSSCQSVSCFVTERLFHQDKTHSSDIE